MMLPRVFNQQNLQQQIGVMTHVMPVCKATVPKKFGEKCLRELRIFPTAVLQQFESIFAYVCVLDKLLNVAANKSR